MRRENSQPQVARQFPLSRSIENPTWALQAQLSFQCRTKTSRLLSVYSISPAIGDFNQLQPQLQLLANGRQTRSGPGEGSVTFQRRSVSYVTGPRQFRAQN